MAQWGEIMIFLSKMLDKKERIMLDSMTTKHVQKYNCEVQFHC